MWISPEHIFHDALAMPDPIPGTVCSISNVCCSTFEDRQTCSTDYRSHANRDRNRIRHGRNIMNKALGGILWGWYLEILLNI